MPETPLDKNQSMWTDPNGHALTLCVLHEFNPRQPTTAQAIVVLGGISVCRDHARAVITMVKMSYNDITPEEVVRELIVSDLSSD